MSRNDWTGSDREVAQDYLAQLQQHHLVYEVDRATTLEEHEEWHKTHPTRLHDIARSLYEETSDASIGAVVSMYQEHLRAAPPGEFHSPHGYSILESICSRLDSVAEPFAPGASVRPVFGIVPIGDLQAMTMRVPFTSERLVLVSEQVFWLANYISKILADSLVYEVTPTTTRAHHEPGRVESNLNELPTVSAAFARVIVSYALTGRSLLAGSYLLRTPHARDVRDELLEAIELAVIGHEYGHIILDHSIEKVSCGKLGEVSFEEVQYRHGEEYAADQYGLILPVVYGRREGRTQSAIGVGLPIFLRMADYIDRARRILATGTDERSLGSNSHPESTDRILAIRSSLGPLLEEDGEYSVQAHDDYSAILEMLWKRTMPVLMALHKDGVRPVLDRLVRIGTVVEGVRKPSAPGTGAERNRRKALRKARRRK